MGSSLTGNRKLKKIAKKFKTLENTIIVSFQAKIGWEWGRKRENEKNRFDGFLPDLECKIPTKEQKNSKN